MKFLNITKIALVLFYLFLTGHVFAEHYYWVGAPSEKGKYYDVAGNWRLNNGDIPSKKPDGNDIIHLGDPQFNTIQRELVIRNKFEECFSIVSSNKSTTPIKITSDNDKGVFQINAEAKIQQNISLDYAGEIIFSNKFGGIRHIFIDALIENADVVFKSEVNVHQGRWILRKPLNVRQDIRLERGFLKTNSQQVYADKFISNNNSEDRKLKLNESQINLTKEWNVDPNLNIHDKKASFILDDMVGSSLVISD